MFESIPIHKRWRIILGIIGFAFLVSLLYARQVWGIYAKIDELQAKTAVIEDADLQIVNRQVRLKQLSDNIRGAQSQDSLVGSHVQLMQYIEAFCDQNRLRLIQLPREQIQDIQGYQIAAIDFSVQGGYHDILALIYQMEAMDHIGTIAKADIELKTIRIDNAREQMLVASLRLNRLIQPNKTATTHEAS
jgi:hypothetical protein